MLFPHVWTHVLAPEDFAAGVCADALYTTGSNGIWDEYFVCNNASAIAADDIKPCNISSPAHLAEFVGMDGASIMFWILVELLLLGTTAVRTACHIAAEFNYRLVPLNAERAFVASALIRPCFEMGNPKSPVLAVDPEVESTALRRLRIALLAVIYAMKIGFVSLIVKMILKGAMSAPHYAWATSYAAVVASCFWDTLIFSVAMQQVTLVAAGIATAPEVFNEILQIHGRPLSRLGRMQAIRAVGVAIVLKGSMHPAMELLLRHAIQYFGLKGSAEMQEPGSLDSIPRFLSDLRKLPPEEQATVLSVHLLAQVMDGGVREPELVLWRRIGLARGLAVDESAVKGVACAFRNHETLGAALLAAALDDDPSNDHAEALGLSDTCWFRVRGLLLK